jgi:osmotically-inducible protein OsmY
MTTKASNQDLRQHERSDAELAQAAVQAIEWNMQVPDGAIKVKVDDGWITLEGLVAWNYQRKQAERAAWSAAGTTEVNNNLKVSRSTYA